MDLGDGNNQLTATGTQIGGGATLQSGNGDDVVNTGTTTIDKGGTLDLGSGDDTLNTNLTVNGDLQAGDGKDDLNVNGPLNVGSAGVLDLGQDTSADTLTVTGDTDIDKAGRSSGDGEDTLEFNGSTNAIDGLVDAGKDGDSLTFGGATTITTNGVVQAGAGKDTVTVNSVTLTGGTLDGGKDTDSLIVNGKSDFSGGTLKNFEGVKIADGVTVKVTETQLESNGTYEGAGVETIQIFGNATDVTGEDTIDNYLYEFDDPDGFKFEVGFAGQNFKSTGASTEDTVDLTDGKDYTGTLSLNGGNDTVDKITGLDGGKIETGGGEDKAFITGDLTSGTIDLGTEDDTVRIDDGESGANQSIGGITLTGGSGTNTLIIDTNGDTVDISEADIIGFTKVQFEGDGVVKMTTTQHQALSPFFDAPGSKDEIQFTDAPGIPATGNPEIETYQLNTSAGPTEDGNTFTVDGKDTDNTGQTVIGGTGKDTVTFRAEEEDGTDIDPGDLDLSGGGSAGDVLNIETVVPTTGLGYNIGAGDVSTFEEINLDLDGGAVNDDNFKIAFADADIDNDLTFTVGGATGQVGDIFGFGTFKDEESSITVEGLVLNETAGGPDKVTISTGDGDDSVSLTAATALTAATEVDIDLDDGSKDSFTFDLNGFDATFDATGNDSFDNTEAFVFTDTGVTATAFSLTLDGAETVQTIDASTLGASFTLDASTISNLLPTASGVAIQDSDTGTASLDVGSAEGGAGGADFTVDLNGGNDDILIDNAGDQQNVVTVLDFTVGNIDDIGLNQTGGGITTATEITTVVGSNDALDTADGDSGAAIGTFVDLTGFAPAIATDLDDVSDGGAVELAIIEAQLDSAAGGSNPAGEVDGDIYVALTDGTDTGIYRATVSTGADFNVDSTADITDLEKVAELVGVSDIDLNDVF